VTPTAPVSRPHAPTTTGDVFDEITGLLRSQRHRIRQRLLWHGLGLLLAATLVGLILYYLADRNLGLPVAVRLLVTAFGLAALGYLAWRHVVRPQRLDLGDPDVAVALEARFPDLREKLISAVQLGALARSDNLRNQSADMIAHVVREAAAQARAIPSERLLTWKHAGRVWLVAGLASLGAGLGVLLRQDAALVFLRRIFGADLAYPRLTTLHLELPPADQDYQITAAPGRVTVTMSAGGDLPVLVRAEGVVPREVFLVIAGGRGMPAQVATAARGGGRFRHVFRRVGDGFSFAAKGGDDDRGDLVVTVVTVRPPRVGTIRAALTYPEYTGRPPSVQEGGSIEALEGTAVVLEVAPLGEVTAGRLQFQESGESLELTPRTVADDGGKRSVLGGAFNVRKSDRYQIDLASKEGLRSPQTATYPIIAVPDAPPGGQILTPQDDGLNALLPEAILALRLIAKDDFAVAKVVAEITVGERDEPVRRELAVPPARVQSVLGILLPLRGLLGDEVAVKEGESITVVVRLLDNRAPQAQETKLPGRTLHVVASNDLERRIAGHFRRVRTDVEKALELQRERRERLGGLLADRSAVPAAEATATLTALQVAQGRLQSMAGRIHAELMRSFNLHLLNPLDQGAQLGGVIDAFARAHGNPDDARPFVFEFYRTLAVQRDAGSVGSLGKFLDRILGMVTAADKVAEQLAPACVQQLASARSDAGELEQRLPNVRGLQDQIVSELEGLLAKLDEWNEFQDVISTTRALRDNQRDVQMRTKSMRK
jgi:hypothetical protein